MPCRDDNCCPLDDLEPFGFNNNFSALNECEVITITTTELDNGTDGSEYEFTLQSSGGTAPVTWTLISGELPDGLTLSSSGVISGVPTESGDFTITVRVTDANGYFCSQPFTLTVEELEDMPLHSAVYDPTRDVIFAVRGGRVFKCSATTGKRISHSQYAGPTLSDSYICYDSGRDKLWVTYSPTFRAPPNNLAPTNDKYIYKLNPDTFAIEQTIGLEANGVESGLPSFNANFVIRHIISNGTQLAFWISDDNFSNGMDFVVFNPDSLPGTTFIRAAPSGARWGFAAVYPSSTNYQYVSDNDFNFGVTRRTNANVFVENSGGYPVIGVQTTPPFTARIYGFAYNSGNNRLYCANRSNLILKLNASVEEVGSAIDVGSASTADIWNIRKRSSDGLIYAADFGTDRIVVINPSDDSFVSKTGFDAPWDLVFTPTKAFAVQHGSVGLKEIT